MNIAALLAFTVFISILCCVVTPKMPSYRADQSESWCHATSAAPMGRRLESAQQSQAQNLGHLVCLRSLTPYQLRSLRTSFGLLSVTRPSQLWQLTGSTTNARLLKRPMSLCDRVTQASGGAPIPIAGISGLVSATCHTSQQPRVGTHTHTDRETHTHTHTDGRTRARARAIESERESESESEREREREGASGK
jgi:hypothetical protein